MFHVCVICLCVSCVCVCVCDVCQLNVPRAVNVIQLLVRSLCLPSLRLRDVLQVLLAEASVQSCKISHNLPYSQIIRRHDDHIDLKDLTKWIKI